MKAHGGKRQGAGRKAGSGKYGEATVAMRVPKSLLDEIKGFVRVKRVQRQTIPLFMASVPAGTPQNLEDHVEDYIDLNEFFIRDPEETFMVTANGESMTGANIKSGDTLIVDRAIEPVNGHIVIAFVNGNLTVKTLRKTSGGIVLQPENKAYEPIAVTKKDGLHIWGVVTHIIHKSA